MIIPNSRIILLKVPLQIDNKNQLTFNNVNEQFNYFYSLSKFEMDNARYQRRDNVIRFPAHYDDIINYNYVMYQNENYNNKWFYAFITNMKYINDNLTEIFISTDVFQSWQFDFIWKQTFVEREMINVTDDVPGANLLPEGLEFGEYKIQNNTTIDDLEPINVIAYLGTSVPVDLQGTVTTDIQEGSFTVNGVTSSVAFLLCDNNNYIIFMNALQHGNFSDKILTTFTVPKLAVKNFLINDNKINLNGYPTVFTVYCLSNGQDYLQDYAIKNLWSTPTQIDNYTPHNKKLLSFPFCYIGFNPPNGMQKIYKFENFTSTPSFYIISEVNPNPSVYFIPRYYRGLTLNLQDSTCLNGYPQTSSRSDYFNNWIAQNGNIISLNMQQEQFNYEVGQVQSGLNMASNLISDVASENIVGVSSLLNSGLSMYKANVNHDFYIKQQMAQIEKQKMLPDQANLSGSNATLIGYNLFKNDIFSLYTIKKQFAERIDKFFDMYGYLTNTVKIPNTNNRPNWNYIKTIGTNIVGDIPQNDIQQLKNIFENGVTLWHNANTFLDYSQNNRTS